MPGSGCDPWPIAWPCDIDNVDPQLVADAHSLAAQLLWSLSGSRIGVCTYTEEFRQPNGGVCSPHRRGHCCRVLLSHRPVASIVEVVDGGAVLEAEHYALEGSWVQRRFGCWTVSHALCDDPDLRITYRSGIPFPAGTAAAVGEVACEYLTALQGGQCRLPSRATSITRQGVTVTLDTAADFVARRRTGLPVADAWLETVVGHGPRVASRVYSPDLPRGTRG